MNTLACGRMLTIFHRGRSSGKNRNTAVASEVAHPPWRRRSGCEAPAERAASSSGRFHRVGHDIRDQARGLEAARDRRPSGCRPFMPTGLALMARSALFKVFRGRPSTPGFRCRPPTQGLSSDAADAPARVRGTKSCRPLRRPGQEAKPVRRLPRQTPPTCFPLASKPLRFNASRKPRPIDHVADQMS